MIEKIRVTRRRLIGFSAIMLAAGLAFALALMPYNVLRQVQTGTMILDRSGNLLRFTTAADGRYRLWMDLDEYAPVLVEAILAKEDRNFWVHPGVDPAALCNAAWHSFVVRDYYAGASTITMQAARLIWKLDTDQIGGKLRQILAALALSAFYSKSQILELYLNLAPCGGNVEGFGAASQIYFGKAPGRLNLAEAMALAVLPQDPARRNPAIAAQWANIERARRLLFAQMLRQNPGLADRALEFDLPLSFRHVLPFFAPHLSDRVIADYPKARRIATTLDLRLQVIVERKIGQFVARGSPLGVTNACAMVVSANDMNVLASVGSADFFNDAIQGQVDGTRARRSPGSTLKPFIYGLAFQQGLIQPLSMLKDTRVHFGGYNPDNFDNDFLGPVSAADALILSRNVPAVSLAGRLQDPDLYGFLEQAGVELPYGREHYGLSMVLGGAEVSMEELVRLYGSLARGGASQDLGLVREIDRSMVVADRHPRRLLTPESSWLVRQILSAKPRPDEDGNFIQGMENIYRPGAVAYKTGTSIGFRDAWAIGIFDGLLVAVWVGNFDGSSNPEFVGLRSAAPLLFQIVEALRANHEVDGYRNTSLPEQPANIIRTELCRISGMLATPLCHDRILAPFIPGVSPIASCSVHQEFNIDAKTGWRRSQEIKGRTHKEIYEIWPADIMELFAQAGLMRRVPPPLDPADQEGEAEAKTNGPTILSPVRGMEYYYDIAAVDERIPLISSMSSDSRKVWWFIDGKLIGSVNGRNPLFWKPQGGWHELKVVDDQGRFGVSRFAALPRTKN